ncbi:MAG: tRNA (guanosine(46)-N7)-methyltransferase TrmB [Verrucomicrobia bacterium]|nr:tRNA (guanosine(46)-N7)-methyltransferase TrmB [Verrucomicrobiota bacterium]
MTQEAYTALIEDRRRTLRTQLEPILADSSRFVLEIGCGHGHFLTAYAGAHPDRVCIGLDLVEDRIQRACRKRDRARLSNLHFLQGEARLFLEVLPPAARLTALYALFPDPWPKLRHHKHRLIQPDFLRQTAAAATPDCRLYFRTDHEEYFASSRAIILAHPSWVLTDETWPFEYETVFQQRASSYQSLVAIPRRA